MAVPFFVPGIQRQDGCARTHFAMIETLFPQSCPPEDALGKVTASLARQLSADRVSVWLCTSDRTHLFCADFFDRTLGEHRKGAELRLAFYQDFWAALAEAETISASKAPSPPPLSRIVCVDFAEAAETNFTPIYDSDRPSGLICVERSCTDRPWTSDEQLLLKTTAALLKALISTHQHMHNENKLEHAASLLSSILESVGEGIVVTGLDRKIVRANHQLLEIFGIASSDWQSLVGTNVRAILGPLVKHPVAAYADADLLYENIEMQAVHVLELLDGRTLERYSQPHSVDGQIVGRIFSYRDISGRVRSQQTRLKLEHQLQQCQKMEALGTLASSIAHDFNNILNVVTCNLNVLKWNLPPHAACDASFKDIGSAIQQASELVNKVLVFGQKKPVEPKLIDLLPFLQQVAKFVRPSIPTSIEIRINTEKDLPPLYADPVLINQVLLNLCINASHAIGDRPGTITVQACTKPITGDLVTANPELKAGDYILLSVADTGCGMDEALIDHIFEPFFTTKTSGNGTGLGLSIVHGIVRAHSGAIVVSSQPNHGTEFNLYFPLSEIGQPFDEKYTK